MQQPQVSNPFTTAGLAQKAHASAANGHPFQSAGAAAPSIPLSPPSKQTFSTSAPAETAASTPTFQFSTSQAAAHSPQPKFPGFGTSQQGQTAVGAFPGFAAGIAGD